jgi:hypothetical protein
VPNCGSALRERGSRRVNPRFGSGSYSRAILPAIRLRNRRRKLTPSGKVRSVPVRGSGTIKRKDVSECPRASYLRLFRWRSSAWRIHVASPCRHRGHPKPTLTLRAPMLASTPRARAVAVSSTRRRRTRRRRLQIAHFET